MLEEAWIFPDGESNRLENLMLCGVYAIAALAFFFSMTAVHPKKPRARSASGRGPAPAVILRVSVRS